MKILVVEDNPRLAERIKHKLHRLHSIDLEDNGHAAIEKAKQVEYDVIVLDLGLPDMSGEQVCKLLRDHEIMTPILILTAIDTFESKVTLLDIGADDYLTKPFDSSELRARITALARRRTRHKPQKIISYYDMNIDLDQRKVTRNNITIELRRKEFDILVYLITNQGRILTRDMIMNHAWDGDKISWNSTIDVHIKHLRDKIDRPFNSQIIKTAYGIGYKVDTEALTTHA